MIISRNEIEGDILLDALKNPSIKMSEIKTGKIGAISLLDNDASQNDLELACSLALAYAKEPSDAKCFFQDKIINSKASEKSKAQKFFVV